MEVTKHILFSGKTWSPEESWDGSEERDSPKAGLAALDRMS